MDDSFREHIPICVYNRLCNRGTKTKDIYDLKHDSSWQIVSHQGNFSLYSCVCAHARVCVCVCVRARTLVCIPENDLKCHFSDDGHPLVNTHSCTGSQLAIQG